MCETVLGFGRYRGNVFSRVDTFFGGFRVDSGVECLQHHGAFLGRQPGADDERSAGMTGYVAGSGLGQVVLAVAGDEIPQGLGRG